MPRRPWRLCPEMALLRPYSSRFKGKEKIGGYMNAGANLPAVATRGGNGIGPGGLRFNGGRPGGTQLDTAGTDDIGADDTGPDRTGRDDAVASGDDLRALAETAWSAGAIE